MKTIIPMGLLCIDCKAKVALVRRTVEQPCDSCDLCDVDHADHRHTIPDCMWLLVDAEGERHRCATT